MLSDKRKKAIKARFREGYTLEQIKQVFTMAEESEFLKGKNDRNWSATFDWMLNTNNMAKILDGNYSTKEKADRVPDKYSVKRVYEDFDF